MLNQSHCACPQLGHSASSCTELCCKPSLNLLCCSPGWYQSVVTLIALPWQISHSCQGDHSVTLNDDKRREEDETEGVSERSQRRRGGTCQTCKSEKGGLMSVAGERKTGGMKCCKKDVIKQEPFRSIKVAGSHPVSCWC